MSFGWYAKNEAFIKPRDARMYELSSATLNSTLVDEENYDVLVQEEVEGRNLHSRLKRIGGTNE